MKYREPAKYILKRNGSMKIVSPGEDSVDSKSLKIKLQKVEVNRNKAIEYWVRKLSPFCEESLAKYYFFVFIDFRERECNSIQQFVQVCAMDTLEAQEKLKLPEEFDFVKTCVKAARIQNGSINDCLEGRRWLYTNENLNELKITSFRNILDTMGGNSVKLAKIIDKLNLV